MNEQSDQPQSEPWWHAAPVQPPVDSVLVEGMKLAAVLRDWAVESGAVSAVTDLAASAAASASAYVSQHQAVADSAPVASEPVASERLEHEPVEPEPVVRCADCPVCRALDALDASNPQMAQTARSALSQITALISGFLPGED